MNDQLSHEQFRDLAAGFVLDALEPAEMDAVRAHLATCTEPHPELVELGGVAAYLAELPEPVEPPAALKGRLMAAIEAEVAATRRAAAAEDQKKRPAPTSIDAERQRRLPLFTPRFALQLAAVLLVAVLGAWDLLLLGQTQTAQQEARTLRDAIAAAGAPGAHVGGIAGTKEQPAASGFVALSPTGGTGYLVVEGLAPAPAGKVYQAWFIAAGVPRSAGVMTTSDGLAVLALSGADPVETVALTIEPAGGSVQPTLPIIAAGQPGA